MKNLKTQHVLVTGGAGYIGSVLVPFLVQQGFFVSVFDSFYFGRRPIQHFPKGVHVIRGDIRRPPSDLFQSIDSVIHLAALSNDPTAEFNPIANEAINTEGTKTIALMAKEKGVRRFVFASSCSIYDCGLCSNIATKTENAEVNPKNPYSRSKFLAERFLLQLTDNTFSPTVLRKGTVYGPSPRMRYDLIVNTMVRDAMRSKKLHVFCRGRQWRPLISIHDVANAYALTIRAPEKLVKGKIINISAGNYQVDGVAKEIQGAFKESLNTDITIVYEKDDKLDRSYRVSTKRAKELLHFFPKETIRESVRALVSAIKKNKALQQFSNPLFYNIERMKPILQSMT